MRVGLRGFAAVVGTAAVAMLVSSQAAATASPKATGTKHIEIVHSCSQKVSAGHSTCFALRRADVGFTSRAQLAERPNATPSGYGPSNLQSAYKLPSSTAGAGQRIYIVDAFDDPNAESDLAAYRSQYGLPACTTANGCFKKLNQNGATSPLPSPDTGWAGEISLDVDMASAVCPKCGITLIEANDNGTNLYVAVKEAATLGAKFVSMSFGGSEFSGETTYDSTYFKPTGVVYAASTGDSAYQAGTSYPAASSAVVAVGGTALHTSTNSRGWTESVWKTSTTEGAGSGCSAYVTKPTWQSAVVPAATCGKKAVGDVSAVADPATGVAVYQTYGGSGWAVYGGTSASAPIVASTFALAGTPSATAKPGSFPYAHTGNLYDVTSGNNGTCTKTLLCTAAAGWDGPTGLGTPNGVAAFRAATGNTVTVTNPGNQTGTVGTAKTLQISATDSAGAALTYSATGLPAGLSISSTTGKITGTPTTDGTYSTKVTAKDSTSATGSASFTWTISPVGGTTCSGQKLLNRGFESGAANWTETAGVITTDGVSPHSGVGYAYLDGYGVTHTDYIQQSVKIPAGCTATLTYYLGIASDEDPSVAYDKLSVSVNGTGLQFFSNRNAGPNYVKRTLDLSSYAGQTVALRWTGKEDDNTATAFFIDDTAVTIS